MKTNSFGFFFCSFRFILHYSIFQLREYSGSFDQMHLSRCCYGACSFIDADLMGYTISDLIRFTEKCKMAKKIDSKKRNETKTETMISEKKTPKPIEKWAILELRVSIKIMNI